MQLLINTKFPFQRYIGCPESGSHDLETNETNQRENNFINQNKEILSNLRKKTRESEEEEQSEKSENDDEWGKEKKNRST